MSKGLFGFLGGGKTTLANARSLFFNCQNRAASPIWYSKGLVGNDFRSKHTMLMLHIWMVHKRLLAPDTGSTGKIVQECMFDELWEDTSSRIRGVGVNELSLNKYLGEVQGYSFKCCVELDHALTKKSEEEIIDEIGGTIWRYTYLRNDNIEVDHVLELAKYVRTEQVSLMDIKKEVILEGRLKWGSFPTWQNNVSNYDDRKKDNINNSNNDGDWREAVASNGKIYYWNIKTRETRWTKE